MLTPKIRISAGKYKGKFVIPPEIENFRSVQDIAKQAVYSIIGAPNIEGSKCLDLYAGSGIMGLEAISRGASHVDFVDENYDAVGAIRNTLLHLDITEDIARVYKIKSVKYVEKAIRNGLKYDFVLCDPFYEDLAHKHLFNLMPQLIEKNGIFVFFHSPENAEFYEQIATTAGFKLSERRKFGDSAFSMFTH